jgi:hypothetical protein
LKTKTLCNQVCRLSGMVNASIIIWAYMLPERLIDTDLLLG